MFLCLPVLVLSVRTARPKRMSWWAVLGIVVFIGWALVLAAAVANETPDDGARRVFTLFFGWVYALVWFIPSLLVYGVIQLVRRWRAKRCDQRIAQGVD